MDPGWYTAPIRAEVRALCHLDAGPDLLAALNALPWNDDGSCPADHSREAGIAGLGTGRPGLPCACLIVTAAAWDAVASWTGHHAAAAVRHAAGDHDVVVEADRELARPALVDPAREDLAPALRISPGSAHGRIDTARRLHALPAVTGLIEAGYCTHVTGKLITGELRNVRGAAAQAITRVVAAKVRARHTAGLRPWGWKDIRALIAALVAALPDDVVAGARDQARTDRKVWVDPQPDGMVTISATIADVDAERIFRRLTAIAAGLDGGDDPRSTNRKRADVFVDLLLDGQITTGGARDRGEATAAKGPATMATRPARQPPAAA